MTSPSHALIDETIDRVARQLTDAEPPARLRARVLATLDQPRASRRLWWLPAVATVTAAVTMVVIWPRTQAPALPALPAFGAISAPLVADATSGVAASEPASPRSVRTRRVSTRLAEPSADELEFRARAIPALDTLTPLSLESIQPQPLSIPLLVISPLTSTATTAGGDGGK